jgi:hypothetical protein
MSTPRFLCVLTIITLLANAAPQSWAAVPFPPNSTVDPCIRVCPAGDMNFHVVVRDAISSPVPFATVVVDFTSCPGVIFCPTSGSDPYTIGPPSVVVMSANAAGVADIPIRAGGVCSGGPVNIYADGVLLASSSVVSSPDQNGDAAVNATDQGILAVKLGGPFDPTADVNCNTTMGGDDATALNGHLGHSCGVVVPVVPRSWGTIKTIYR